ncbi:hypothetical protein C5167_033895 [Papaver somniferum]|uniref:Uncharacterized protein n=1 Tax=Papaver somniferum TaxID=3469 RepID=A0A4Y7KF10_PAPSO|nr:hypothetical protein C5167_033895 [Papaver somniferum]
MRIVQEGAFEAKMLLLLLLLLNRLTWISVLQLLVSVETHYLRNSIEEVVDNSLAQLHIESSQGRNFCQARVGNSVKPGSFQNTSQVDPDSLVALGGSSAEGVLLDMIKTASSMIVQISPEEL